MPCGPWLVSNWTDRLRSNYLGLAGADYIRVAPANYSFVRGNLSSVYTINWRHRVLFSLEWLVQKYTLKDIFFIFFNRGYSSNNHWKIISIKWTMQDINKSFIPFQYCRTTLQSYHITSSSSHHVNNRYVNASELLIITPYKARSSGCSRYYPLTNNQSRNFPWKMDLRILL